LVVDAMPAHVALSNELYVTLPFGVKPATLDTVEVS